MNKALKRLAIISAIFGFAALSATTKTGGKTFLMPRSHGVNLAMEYTTFHDLIGRKDDDKFGADFQVTGFYRDSTNESDLGEYFIGGDKDTFSIKDADEVGYVIHKHDGNNDADAGNFKWRPSQTAYGVTINYNQDLEKIYEGLYFKVSLPIVHVKNDMNSEITKISDALDNVANLVKYFKG